MGNWAFDNRDGATNTVGGEPTAIGEMVNGPASPPAGTGSAHLAVGDGMVGGDGTSELRNTGYAGVALSQITALSYSTYATLNNGQQFPYFGLMIATTGSGPADDILFFEPPYQQAGTGNPNALNQPATQLNTWQTWNALGGSWWDNNANYTGGTGAGTFADFLALFPNAVIVNADDGLGGVRFNVGFASNNDQFNGYVDNFTIGVLGNNTTYDFEASIATPVPAALPLFASGLGMMGLLGWRRKRKMAGA
jgi:hypothetical protein